MPVILFILLLVFSFFIVRPLLLPIFVGALLAYTFYPSYQYILKKTGKASLSSFLVCFFILLIIVIPAVFILKIVIQESYTIFLLLKQKLASGLFTECSSELCRAISEFIHSEFVSAQLKQIIGNATQWIIEKGSAFVLNIPHLVISLFVIFFTLFYFLKDGENLLKQLQHYFQPHQKNYAVMLVRTKEILHGMVYGYLLIALIQGILGAFGFFLFGVSSPLFWGLMMAFFALIPAVGTGIIWVPASLFIFLDGIFQNSTLLILKGIGLFTYSFIFVSSIDNVLRPKIISEKTKVHTAIIMIGIFGGILLLGPLGVVLGPLILSLTIEAIKMYLGEK